MINDHWRLLRAERMLADCQENQIIIGQPYPNIQSVCLKAVKTWSFRLPNNLKKVLVLEYWYHVQKMLGYSTFWAQKEAKNKNANYANSAFSSQKIMRIVLVMANYVKTSASKLCQSLSWSGVYLYLTWDDTWRFHMKCSLVFSRLYYCSSVWGNTSKKNIAKITERAKFCGRYYNRH